MGSTALLIFATVITLTAVLLWLKLKNQNLSTLNSFFLADKKLNFFLVGSTLFFSNLNNVLLIGENELTFKSNMTVMAWGMTSIIAMIVVAEYFIPIYLKTGITTIPEYLENRFDKQTKYIVSVIILVGYLVNMLPSVLYSGVISFNGLFNLTDIWHISYQSAIWILVWVMGTIGCIYTILGGFKAIVISDTLLGIGFFLIAVFILFYSLKYVGHGNFLNGLHIFLNTKKTHFNSIGTAKDPIPFSTLFTGMVLMNLYYWGTEQYIIQNVFSSKSLAEGQKGMILAGFGKIFSPLILNIPGIIALHVFKAPHNTAEVFPKLINIVSPDILKGFFAVVLFGAALTTFNAGLKASSMLFVLNLYKPWINYRNNEVSERQLVRTGRKFEFFAAFAAMCIGPSIMFVHAGLYTYLQMVGGLFSVPIFTIVLIGFTTKKVPPLAVKSGLAFFVLAYIICQTFIKLPIHFLHLLAVLFIISTIIILFIGKLYPLPVPYKQALNNQVAIIPYKFRYYYYTALIVLMVAAFVIFSTLILAK